MSGCLFHEPPGDERTATSLGSTAMAGAGIKMAGRGQFEVYGKAASGGLVEAAGIAVAKRGTAAP